MKVFIVLVAIIAAGCSAAQVTADLQTPAGQLFCAIQTGGGGSIVVGLIDAEASAVPGAAPVAISVTGATKAAVDADCAAAAVATGGTAGVPVSPPAPAAAPPPAVAIVAPAM